MKRKKLLIEDIYDNGIDTLIPNNIPQFIQSTEWWIVFKEYFDELLLQLKGSYTLNLPRVKDYNNISDVVSNIGAIIRLHLVARFYEYDGLYKTTQLEYNPIWNVDGTVNVEGKRVSENASSSESNLQHDIKHTGADTTLHTGEDKLSKSGNDTLAHSGEDKTSKSGSDILKKRGTFSVSEHTLHLEVPMDSQEFLNNSKDEKSATTSYDTPEDTTEYGSIDTTAYGSKDTTEYGSIDTTTYGGRNTLEYGKNENETSKTTDGMESTSDETYSELTTRQGNIGVTTTQAMIREERAIVNFSWLEYVVNDIAPRFTEGVLFTI